MITVEEALKRIKQNIKPTKVVESRLLKDSLNYVLASNVISPINMPPFRQSAMDGYALNIHDKDEYIVIDEIKAGDSHQPSLEPGEATRIFTGAPVPDTSNAIIIQEHTSISNKKLTANYPVSYNANIRPLGEQIKKGKTALKKSTKLNASGIAFLTSLGLTEVEVFKKPSIGLVVTGNELAEAGSNLQFGQIYESNTIMLASALKSIGYTNVEITSVADNYQSTYNILKQMLAKHEMLLVSGGISVGDYDFVGKALLDLGVKQLFYKVKQKPGKPLFFGKKEDSLVFALPGNPASALSCFYIYVQTALEKMSGNINFKLTKTSSKSLSTFTKKSDRAHFLKAIYNNNSVEILEGQNSSMLHTFALANALVYLPETTHVVKIDDPLEVILLPIH